MLQLLIKKEKRKELKKIFIIQKNKWFGYTNGNRFFLSQIHILLALHIKNNKRVRKHWWNYIHFQSFFNPRKNYLSKKKREFVWKNLNVMKVEGYGVEEGLVNVRRGGMKMFVRNCRNNFLFFYIYRCILFKNVYRCE